jgi:hypothetical protein
LGTRSCGPIGGVPSQPPSAESRAFVLARSSGTLSPGVLRQGLITAVATPLEWQRTVVAAAIIVALLALPTARFNVGRSGADVEAVAPGAPPTPLAVVTSPKNLRPYSAKDIALEQKRGGEQIAVSKRAATD